MPAGRRFTTLELKVNLTRPLTEEVGDCCAAKATVRPRRRPHRPRRKARIVDAHGKLYAHGTTTCIVVDAPRRASGAVRSEFASAFRLSGFCILTTRLAEVFVHMSDLVRYDVIDGVAVVTIDNPPVNALAPGGVGRDRRGGRARRAPIRRPTRSC